MKQPPDQVAKRIFEARLDTAIAEAKRLLFTEVFRDHKRDEVAVDERELTILMERLLLDQERGIMVPGKVTFMARCREFLRESRLPQQRKAKLASMLETYLRGIWDGRYPEGRDPAAFCEE